MIYAEGCDDDYVKDLEDALDGTATALSAMGEAELKLAIAKPGDQLGNRLRGLMGLPGPTDEPLVTLVDLQENKSFFIAKVSL